MYQPKTTAHLVGRMQASAKAARPRCTAMLGYAPVMRRLTVLGLLLQFPHAAVTWRLHLPKQKRPAAQAGTPEPCCS